MLRGLHCAHVPTKIHDPILPTTAAEPCSDREGMAPVRPSWYASLIEWDKDASYLVYRWYGTHVVTRLPLLILEVSGHGVPWLIIPILIFLFKTELSATAAALMLNFLALTLLDLGVIGILKPLFRRSRPAYNTGIGHMTIHAVDQFSFPSGHSTRAGFLSSFVWHTQYHHADGLASWINCPAFTMFVLIWAIALCMSRVALGRHHVLDVIFGYLLGVVYVYAWDPVWIGASFADGLRSDLRSSLFGVTETNVAKLAPAFDSPL